MCISSGCASILLSVQQIQPVRMPSSMLPSGTAPPTLASILMRLAFLLSFIFSSLRPSKPAAFALRPCSRRRNRAKVSAATWRCFSDRAVPMIMMSFGPSAGGGSRCLRSSNSRSSRPAVIDTYSRMVWRRGGGLGGKSGISMGFWACSRKADCWRRYHGIVKSAAGLASTSAALAVSVAAAVPSSRKANSGSSAEGSFRSVCKGVLVLNALLRDLLGVALPRRDARCTAPLTGSVDDRAAALWHALHTKLDEAARERYMLKRYGVVRRVFRDDVVTPTFRNRTCKRRAAARAHVMIR
jgi:hypothetical protein